MNNLLYSLDAISPAQAAANVITGLLPLIIGVLVTGVAAAAFFVVRKKKRK